MPAHNARAFYIDLFDDGIPEINVLVDDVSHSSVERRLLDAIRFQVLLAILFERQVAIPESWAISSPAFLRVFSEVKNAYPDEINREDSAGTVRARAMKPFVLCLFTGRGNSPAVAYLDAFIERLKNKRVQCLSGLDSAYPSLDGNPRKTIAEYFGGLIQSFVDKGKMDYQKLRHELTIAIHNGFDRRIPSEKASSVALAIGDVIEYLGDPIVINETQFWGSEEGDRYRDTVKDNMVRIHQSLDDLYGLGELYPSQTRAFREFFNEALRGKVSFDNVMGLWEIAKRCDPEMRKTIEAFGRYALNRGYGKVAGPAQNTLSFDYYSHGSPSEFAYTMLGKVAELEQVSSSLKASFASFIEMAPSQKYDLDYAVEWKNAWQSAAIVAANERWKKKREKIERKAWELVQEHRDVTVEIWCELFDEINAAFQDLAFCVMGGESPSVKLVKRAIHGVESDVATVALKVLERFMRKFVEHVPTGMVLKGLRKLTDVRIVRKHTKLISHA